MTSRSQILKAIACYLMISVASEGYSITMCYFKSDDPDPRVDQTLEEFKKTSKIDMEIKVISADFFASNQSFEEMVKSKTKCDGLIIYKQAADLLEGDVDVMSGALDISLVEKMACGDEYKNWFDQVKLVLPVGSKARKRFEIVDMSDKKMDEHLRASRYLRIFPGSQMCGEDLNSSDQLDSKCLMEVMAKIKDDSLKTQTADVVSGLKKVGGLTDEVCQSGCLPSVKTDESKEGSRALVNDALIKKVKSIDCLLLNELASDAEILKTVDVILKDAKLIQYNFDALWDLLIRLKNGNREDLFKKITEKLKLSNLGIDEMKRKVESDHVSPVYKIQLLNFFIAHKVLINEADYLMKLGKKSTDNVKLITDVLSGLDQPIKDGIKVLNDVYTTYKEHKENVFVARNVLDALSKMPVADIKDAGKLLQNIASTLGEKSPEVALDVAIALGKPGKFALIPKEKVGILKNLYNKHVESSAVALSVVNALDSIDDLKEKNELKQQILSQICVGDDKPVDVCDKLK